MAATAVTIIGGSGYNRGNTFTAAAGPTKDNDGIAAFPHQVADTIIDTVGGVAYTCISNATGAAVWSSDSNKKSAVSATFTPAASTPNVCLLSVQLKDGEGANLAVATNFDLWLSDTATTGAGLTSHTASGAVAAGASGTDIGDYTAKKAKRVQSDVTGLYILSITDTGKNLFVPAVQLGPGNISVGAALITGNYG